MVADDQAAVPEGIGGKFGPGLGAVNSHLQFGIADGVVTPDEYSARDPQELGHKHSHGSVVICKPDED